MEKWITTTRQYGITGAHQQLTRATNNKQQQHLWGAKNIDGHTHTHTHRGEQEMTSNRRKQNKNTNTMSIPMQTLNKNRQPTGQKSRHRHTIHRNEKQAKRRKNNKESIIVYGIRVPHIT